MFKRLSKTTILSAASQLKESSAANLEVLSVIRILIPTSK